jgi:hypothetical protein
MIAKAMANPTKTNTDFPEFIAPSFAFGPLKICSEERINPRMTLVKGDERETEERRNCEIAKVRRRLIRLWVPRLSS